VEAPFKRYLIDYYRSLMEEQANKVLERYFTNELKFEDEEKQKYRSEEDLQVIKIESKDQCETMTKELVDELEAEGIATSQDFIEKYLIAERIQEKYLDKLEKYLREIK
jgi:hypothetical protein